MFYTCIYIKIEKIIVSTILRLIVVLDRNSVDVSDKTQN